MMAAELYKKTLAGYEASLSKRDPVSLSRYCKIHHVDSRGLSYWMKKNSIDTPKNTSGKVADHSGSNTDQPVTWPVHMVPLLIRDPIREKAPIRSKSSLKGVNITTQTGLVVCIQEISCVDLAALIQTCNTR